MMSSCWQSNDAAADVLSNSHAEGAGLAGLLFWCLLGAHLCQTLQQAAFSWGRCTLYKQSEILRQCKTQNSGLCSKEEKPRDPMN